jgi:Zn-dependent metalloprotease
MKAPVAACGDPVTGQDPQPGHTDAHVVTDDDHGGVHLNSGIPKRAFYELATRLKGYAWE